MYIIVGGLIVEKKKITTNNKNIKAKQHYREHKSNLKGMIKKILYIRFKCKR